MVLAKERLHHQEETNHLSNSEKPYVNQTRECIVEMNEQLMRLVEVHDFDFVRVAGSFQKFIVFLKSVYEKELVNIEPQIFTPDICRARYAALDWGKWNYIGETKPTSPNNYEETKRKQAENLRSKYKQMHKEVNRILPSIEDQDSDDENIFSSGLPPPSEFEKQFFSTDVDFWNIHSSNNEARSDKPKNIEELEQEWAKVGDFVKSPQPTIKKTAPVMEIDVYKKLSEYDLDTKEIEFEQKVEISSNKTNSEKNSKPKSKSKEPQEAVTDKRAKSRMSRMQIVEHDSD